MHTATPSPDRERHRTELHWWRQVIDPAEAEFLRTTCPQGTRTILPVCARCQRQVAWSPAFHTHACFACDRWLTDPCAQGCAPCRTRPGRPSGVEGTWR